MEASHRTKSTTRPCLGSLRESLAPFWQHHCRNHCFDHGFDHWYSAGCRCVHAAPSCATLRFKARTIASTGPLVANYCCPGNVRRVVVLLTSGLHHCIDHWIGHWSATGRPLVRPLVGGCVPTRPPFTLVRFFAQTTGSTGPLVGYSRQPGGNLKCLLKVGTSGGWRTAPVVHLSLYLSKTFYLFNILIQQIHLCDHLTPPRNQHSISTPT